MSHADTIVAIATAPGRAGIGVVRVSGPAARVISAAVVRRELTPRKATLRDFVDGDGRPMDRGIAILYPAPHSYTGEDVLELQGHGGLAVQQLILRRCIDLGARHALPGEFTQRAFLNGRLDLAQAESVADLIDASSAAAARGAMRSLCGEFSDRVKRLERELIELRTFVEATLDFPEEEIDLPQRALITARMEALRRNLATLRSETEQGRILRDGIRVVLIGRPNVGKSSLMNRLAEQEVAIVTDVPGTTRDPLRHELVFEGVPVHVVDTAGLRESSDPVEKIGIERSWREIREADLAVLIVEDMTGLDAGDESILLSLPADLKKLLVFNKIDLTNRRPGGFACGELPSVCVSAKTGAGLGDFRKTVLRSVGWQSAGENVFSARERHIAALARAEYALARAIAISGAFELVAEELRLVQEAFAELTGKFSADDLLGEIFSRFCLGK